jgi:uncharacterized repeat protein (TIGR03803 family)
MVSPAQIMTTLYDFCSQSNCADGSLPYYGTLTLATDGNFYGTTFSGGAHGQYGTVYKITPNGILTTLYSFCAQTNCADGAYPYAAVVQATDGNFYGTTYIGGAHGQYGTVFKITANGVFSTLYSFCAQTNCADGANPAAGLVQGTDGNFYGTTTANGSNNAGTVFKITSNGTLSTLYNFCSKANCADGSTPYAGLVLATDGNFYGTTQSGGGANNIGTVFKITPMGMLTTLYSFCSQMHCADGSYPDAGLVQGTDGNFYGTTSSGGANGYGTVFKITPMGALTTLHSFCTLTNCADGFMPIAGLLQGADGNFYGTTYEGGNSASAGTLFKITSTGTLTTLYDFCSQANCTDGAAPRAGLVQTADGSFYGTTNGGGLDGSGTVFRLSAKAQFVSVPPCRLVDTRTQSGGGGPIQGGTSQTFNLPQLAQLGKNCPAFVLSSPIAYSLNVAVVPPGPLGYLTVWPAGQYQPVISTLNSPDGRVKANAAIVPAGVSSAVNVYASNTTDVVLDIDGYFAVAGPSTQAFYTLTPCRVVDTRNPNGALGGPYLQGQMPRDFPVLQSPCFSGVNSPAAYSFNFTAVPRGGQPLGYLTVWPKGQNQPVVSTLNDLTGTVVANAALLPAGSKGDIEVFASNDTDLVVDVNGYFAASNGQNPLSLYPVPPCRALDTRNGNGAFVGELTVDVVDSVCKPPSSARAYVFGVTVVPEGPLGYLTLWPDGENQPVAATLNAIDGAVTSNMAIVPTNNGKIDAYASNLTELVLDISSYFAP